MTGSIKKRITRVGGRSRNAVISVGMALLFLGDVLWRLVSTRPMLQEWVKQVADIGVRTLPVLIVAAFFTGMVVALQFYETLIRFGSVDLLGPAVAMSLIRELGPVMTALMVIARVSSSTCAEVGIMRNEQQFDALECMAIDPKALVLLPKLLAAVVSVPILTAIFDLIGMCGGYIVGVLVHGESGGTYINGIMDTITPTDVRMGQVKSLVFGLIIMWIPLFKGYFIHLDTRKSGSRGVSLATTEAVVLSAILMLVADYIISALML